jgi:hypothetical protein
MNTCTALNQENVKVGQENVKVGTIVYSKGQYDQTWSFYRVEKINPKSITLKELKATEKRLKGDPTIPQPPTITMEYRIDTNNGDGKQVCARYNEKYKMYMIYGASLTQISDNDTTVQIVKRHPIWGYTD